MSSILDKIYEEWEEQSSKVFKNNERQEELNMADYSEYTKLMEINEEDWGIE